MVGHPVVPASRAHLSPWNPNPQNLNPGRSRAERLRSYGALAWCYDELASAYSAGRIRAAKHAHLADLVPGERVLYVGAGRAEEALVAARLGAKVTVLDCAPEMVDRFRGARDAAGLSGEAVVGDLFTSGAVAGDYDCIAAHFVLNVFSRAVALEALAHLTRQLGPGGRLVTADFAPPSGSGPIRLLAHAYYLPLNLAGWSMGLAAFHGIHDIEAMLETLGWQVAHRTRFGPYEALTAVAKREI